MSSRCHPASYKSFCFPSFSDPSFSFPSFPGPSSGVRLIPFPTQSMAMQWYHTRILSTSLGAKEVTSKSKTKGKSRRQSLKPVGMQSWYLLSLVQGGLDGMGVVDPPLSAHLCACSPLQILGGQWGHREDGRVLTGERMHCPIPGRRLEGALRETGPVEGGPAHGGWNEMLFKDPSKSNHKKPNVTQIGRGTEEQEAPSLSGCPVLGLWSRVVTIAKSRCDRREKPHPP